MHSSLAYLYLGVSLLFLMEAIRTRKWLGEIANQKHEALNFIAAHPKLTALLAGFGITVTFSFVGRFAGESLSFNVPTAYAQQFDEFPTDIPAEKFPKIGLAPCFACLEKIPFLEGDTEV